MKRSKECDVINDEDFILWSGVINLRNCLVHNNGISDTNGEYNYPNIVLILKVDNMTQGDLLLFGYLLEWLLDASRQWMISLLYNIKS